MQCYSLVKIGFDIAENEARQVSCMIRAREPWFGIVPGLGLKSTELPLLRLGGTVQENPHMRAFWASTCSFFIAFVGWFASWWNWIYSSLLRQNRKTPRKVENHPNFNSRQLVVGFIKETFCERWFIFSIFKLSTNIEIHFKNSARFRNCFATSR